MPWDEAENGEDDTPENKGKMRRYMGAAVSAMGRLSYRKDKSGDGSESEGEGLEKPRRSRWVRTPREKKAKDADTPSRGAKAVDAGKEVLAKAKKAKQATLAVGSAAVAKAAEMRERRAERRAVRRAEKLKEEKEATTKKDTSKKDASKKESTKKDTAKKETAKKETAKKETAKKEAAKKETAKKESTKKDKSAAKVPSTPWCCEVCTLENEGKEKKCAVCETARPGVAQEAEAAPTSKTDKMGKSGSAKGLGLGRLSKAIKGGA